jgi:hypothetical protein
MADLVIVATAGSASANSFVTELEAIAYANTRLNRGAWETIDDTECTEDEKRALIEATREISALRFKGERVTSTQVLSWPREDCPNPDSPGIDTVGGETLGDYPSDAIPQRVKDATCELALQFIKAGTTDVAALDPNIGIVQKTTGPLSTTYAEPHQRAQGLARFPRVMALLAPLLDAGRTGGLTVVRT